MRKGYEDKGLCYDDMCARSLTFGVMCLKYPWQNEKFPDF